MKKFFYLLTIGLCGWFSANAESQLVLQMRNGQMHTYVLSQQPAMSFGEGTLIMNSSDAEATFPLADIEKFYFTDHDSGISAVNDEGRRFAYIEGVIMVDGQVGSVELTTLAGHRLHATQSGEAFYFDLKDQPQGTYLLRIGQQCIKLYHK